VSAKQVPIAVVGVSALFPGSSDAQGFWRDILAGRDLITDVPASHWLIDDYYDPDPSAPDKTYCKRGSFLTPVDFDPMEFGLPPSTLPATDTAQILSLIVAQKVLDDASQGQFASMDRERMSCILGVTSTQELVSSLASRLQKPVWIKALRESGIEESEAQAICERINQNYVPWQEASFPGLLGNVVAGRIANRLDLRGTNCVTDAACASSLAALSLAINELSLGQSDVVITGGADALNDIFMYICFSKTPALSPSGDCRPFSDKADGTILGEGLAMVALKRLEDAERDGDRVYAVLKGLGSSSDGRSKSVYAPVPEGQAKALRRTYERAGYGFDTVELVEAHGTGTKAGDAAEFAGLKQMSAGYGEGLVSGSGNDFKKPWCALGTVKSQIGHTKAAAGAAGLFKIVMALHHKVLPPTIKVDQPNPGMGIEGSAFYLNTKTRPWIRDSSHPRRASVSSFGFGGSNFHVTAEEYTPSGKAQNAYRLRARGTELVLLSQDTSAALVASAKEMLGGKDLATISRESHMRFDAKHGFRLAITASGFEDLRAKLEAAIDAISKKPDADFSTPTGAHYRASASAGELAFVFPGQGSQYVGMGADLAMEFDAARRVWDEAASLRYDDEDGLATGIHEVVFPVPGFSVEGEMSQTERLTRTEWAQPAIGLVSASMVALLNELHIKPTCVAGHSFGEISALHAAGAVSLLDLVGIAHRRGELMAGASTHAGAMSAIAASIEEVEKRLATYKTDVVVANHNGPTQVVISGPTASIEEAERRFSADGIRARRLPVSTAFHSPLVADAQKPFADFLAKRKLGAPTMDVYSNVDARVHSGDAKEIRAQLATQLASRVRFVEEIEAMYARGVRTFVEVGPGSVLTDMIGRILEGRPHDVVALDRKGKNGVQSLFDGLGKLAASGVPMSLASLFANYAPPREPTKKKPGMAIPISGTNYGKPYPPQGGTAALPQPNRTARVAQAPASAQATPAPSQAPQIAAQATSLAPVSAPRASVSISRPTLTMNAPMTTPNPNAHASWIYAFQEAQRQTAEAHVAYQRSMAESHAAFLNTAQSAFAGLTQVLSGQPVTFAAAPAQTYAATQAQPYAALPSPQPVFAPAPQPVYAPAPAPVAYVAPQAAAPVAPAPMRAAAAPAAQTNGHAAHTNGASNGQAAAGPVDLNDVMLKIVAEKTGYPVDMLGLEMELEADLGIDSIKRVEILSTMRTRVPNLPEVKASELGALRTLGEIVDYMQKAGGDSKKSEGVSVKNAGASSVGTAGTPKANLLRVAVKEVPLARSGFAWPGLFAGNKVVITDDRGGVAQALAARLIARGVHAEVAHDVPADADVLLMLHGLRSITSPADAIAMQRDAFLALKNVAAAMEEKGGAVLNVQNTGGDFGLSGRAEVRAWGAGLAALMRTFVLEAPKALVRSIDCEVGSDDAGEVADRIVRELVEGGTTQEIGLRADGARNALVAVDSAMTQGPISLGEKDVIVVSGGARGVTAACVIELAKKGQSRFILLGRSVIENEPAFLANARSEGEIRNALIADGKARGEKLAPAAIGKRVQELLATREIDGTMKAIEAAGGKVAYRAVDVRDAAALSAMLDELRPSLGAVTGILHGAGVLADRMLKEKTVEQFDRVFETKVGGLVALLEATKSDDLRMLSFFSSVAARTGNAGQSDYAMANEVLNAVACAERARRGDKCHVRAIGWGPWEGGMVTPTLASHFTERGVALIGLEAGAKHLVNELCDKGADTVVVVACQIGSGGLGAGVPKTASAYIDITPKSHAFLEDHRVAGTIVVPVAMVLEWFARFGRELCPELSCISVDDLRVMRSIKITGASTRIELRGTVERGERGAKIAVELREPGKLAPFYRANVSMGAADKTVTKASIPDGLGSFGDAAIYDGQLLFHGPAFQTLTRIDGISDRAAVGSMRAMDELGWPSGAWQLDPAIVDGALQLAVLWAKKAISGATLPMAVGALRLHDTSRAVTRGIVKARETSKDRALCDVFLVDAEGVVALELLGVETILRPDMNESAASKNVASTSPRA
jgi:malonyl CoA-acyl carrier protein transacylase